MRPFGWVYLNVRDAVLSMVERIKLFFNITVELKDEDIVWFWTDYEEWTLGDDLYCNVIITDPSKKADHFCRKVLGKSLTDTIVWWNAGGGDEVRGSIFETNLTSLLWMAGREDELKRF